jgi:hypothetical protein
LNFPMVATRDIAARAAELLAGSIENGRVEYLLGPQNYSQQDATTALGQAIGRPELPYVQFSYDDAKQGMLRAGLSESMANPLRRDDAQHERGKGNGGRPARRWQHYAHYAAGICAASICARIPRGYGECAGHGLVKEQIKLLNYLARASPVAKLAAHRQAVRPSCFAEPGELTAPTNFAFPKPLRSTGEAFAIFAPCLCFITSTKARAGPWLSSTACLAPLTIGRPWLGAGLPKPACGW